MKRRIPFVVFLLVLAVSIRVIHYARARLIEAMTFDEMRDKSELVVIAKAASSHDSGETSRTVWGTMIGVNTRVQIESVLKAPPNFKSEFVTVFHNREGKSSGIANGPTCIQFEMIPGVDGPFYLMYLKPYDKNRWISMTGTLDSNRGIFKLAESVPSE